MARLSTIAILTVVVLSISTTQGCPECQGVGKKYKIELDHCGPSPQPLPMINDAPCVAPAVEKPVIELPANIPSAKTIDHKCHCVKTIVKPQPVRQLIIVPVYQRYLRTFYQPVVETVRYSSTPVCAQDSGCGYAPPCAPLPLPPNGVPPCVPLPSPPCASLSLPPSGVPPCIPLPSPPCALPPSVPLPPAPCAYPQF